MANTAAFINNKVIMFDAALQSAADVSMKVYAICWVSNEASNRDIAADDDMLLTDIDYNPIIGMRAEGTGNDLQIYLGGLVFNGFRATVLDGGNLWIIGERV